MHSTRMTVRKDPGTCVNRPGAWPHLRRGATQCRLPMPHKDPEARRQYAREYQAANREKLSAQSVERNRKWVPANRERARENQRRYREKNRAKRNAASRKRYRDNNARELARFFSYRHGPDGERWFAAAWEAQGGLCYLCEEPLAEDRSQVTVDHDHSCCPIKRSCAACRRGLACHRCNVMLGRVFDDPDLLEKIAANLRPVVAATRARIAAKPTQMELGI